MLSCLTQVSAEEQSLQQAWCFPFPHFVLIFGSVLIRYMTYSRIWVGKRVSVTNTVEGGTVGTPMLTVYTQEQLHNFPDLLQNEIAGTVIQKAGKKYVTFFCSLSVNLSWLLLLAL